MRRAKCINPTHHTAKQPLKDAKSISHLLCRLVIRKAAVRDCCGIALHERQRARRLRTVELEHGPGGGGAIVGSVGGVDKDVRVEFRMSANAPADCALMIHFFIETTQASPTPPLMNSSCDM